MGPSHEQPIYVTQDKQFEPLAKIVQRVKNNVAECVLINQYLQ